MDAKTATGASMLQKYHSSHVLENIYLFFDRIQRQLELYMCTALNHGQIVAEPYADTSVFLQHINDLSTPPKEAVEWLLLHTVASLISAKNSRIFRPLF